MPTDATFFIWGHMAWSHHRVNRTKCGCDLLWWRGVRAAGVCAILRSTGRADPTIAVATQQSTGDLTRSQILLVRGGLLELSGVGRARHPFPFCCCSLEACVERTAFL